MYFDSTRSDMQSRLAQLFHEMRSLLGEERISVKVWCDVLETVYVKQLDDGCFLIFDHYETFTDLSERFDAYKPLAEIGLDSIRRICEKYEVSLLNLSSEEEVLQPDWYAIGTFVSSDEQVKIAIAKVSRCIDEIFEYAMNS